MNFDPCQKPESNTPPRSESIRNAVAEEEKPWKCRIGDFRVAIANHLCICAAAAELARMKPETVEKMCPGVKSAAERVSRLTQQFCEMVNGELASQLEEEQAEEPGPATAVERGKPLIEKHVPWRIREETFRSDIQHMLDYSLAAVEAVRLKAEGADALVSRALELEKLTRQLTREFCDRVQRELVNRVEEQKLAKERKAWRRAPGYCPGPKADGGEGWMYSRNGD
jgi:hypothetical protein